MQTLARPLDYTVSQVYYCPRKSAALLMKARKYNQFHATEHHELEIHLPDEWWAEAGMADFMPSSRSYRSHRTSYQDQSMHEVCIDDVAAAHRGPGAGVFNDSDEDGSARERVVRILQGFRSDEAIPPVEIAADGSGQHRYKLVNGTHRFYCSLAAGFTHVPAVQGFDWDMLDK